MRLGVTQRYRHQLMSHELLLRVPEPNIRPVLVHVLRQHYYFYNKDSDVYFTWFIYNKYTLWAIKTRHVYFCDNSGKYWPIFVIFALLNELRNKNLFKFLPHLKSVAALPCETWTVKCTTVRHLIYNRTRDTIGGSKNRNSRNPQIPPKIYEIQCLH